MLYLIAIICGYVFYLFGILVHVLVIHKRLSFKWVNGGRSASYEAQYKTSIMSVIILVVGLVLLLMYHLFPEFSKTIFGMILMGILSLYWLMGFVMQLMGTTFEKKYMSPLLATGVFAHVVVFIHFFIS